MASIAVLLLLLVEIVCFIYFTLIIKFNLLLELFAVGSATDQTCAGTATGSASLSALGGTQSGYTVSVCFFKYHIIILL